MIASEIDFLRFDMSGGRTVVDRITESLLTEFSTENSLTTLSESKRFEHFCAYSIIKSQHSETFDTLDVIVGDGGNSSQGSDTGLDAIGVLVNGRLVTDSEELEEHTQSSYIEATFILVQSETSAHFDAAKIGTFAFGCLDFFSESPKLQRNGRVAMYAELAQRIYGHSNKFSRGNPVCKLYYVTTGKWQNEIPLRARIDQARSDLSDTGLFSQVMVEPIGYEGVQKLYRRTKNPIQATFDFASKVTVKPEIPGVAQAYIGFLPWSEFKKIILDESGNLKGGLFFDNVRDWQGYNPVNSGIRDTLESADKGRFVLMNNGLTIIAARVQPTADRFLIEDYQIVNGCQTTNVLFESGNIIGDNVTIPLRLISTNDETIRNSIVKANNWQTQVKEEQLFALEEYPKKLEAFFAAHPPPTKLFFERRSCQYDAQSVEKTRIVTFDGLIRSFAAMFLNEPHRTTRNFKGLKAKLGTEIYAKDQQMEPYHTAAFAYYKIDFMLRNGRLATKFSPAKYHILFALRIMLAGWDRPGLGSFAMKSYCEAMMLVLGDPVQAEAQILSAAAVVESAAGGELDRDNIRTEPFTNLVKDLALSQTLGVATNG